MQKTECKQIYFSKRIVPLEESLVSIESDKDIRELVGLRSSSIMFVYMLNIMR